MSNFGESFSGGINPSGLAPQGSAVLVKPYEPELTKTTIVVPPSAEERNTMIETRALVLEIGPDAWKDMTPRAKVGDKILMARFAGYMVVGPADGKRYRVINARDIYCKITKEVAL